MAKTWSKGLLLTILTIATAGCQASGTVSATPTSSVAPSAAPASAPSAAPAASDADRAFIDGMVPHHEMAVMMADDALAKASRTELKDFARKVKEDQGKEITELKAWRQAWFGSSATPAMDHGSMGQAAMPAGSDYDRRWADEMVKHHQGAITMAQTALAANTRPEVKAMAQRIVDTQKAEQTQLETWSRAWAQ